MSYVARIINPFQSTPSGGKATRRRCITPLSSGCFNPRLPGGRRRGPGPGAGWTESFQSTPSGGKATQVVPLIEISTAFQSTPSGGKATPYFGGKYTIVDVSIHAFRGEGDWLRIFSPHCPRSFNPRLPGGRRRGALRSCGTWWSFQSTPSGGKATGQPPLTGSPEVVSIHAFRGEGDFSSLRYPIPISVSIHAFRGEGDAPWRAKDGSFMLFQSTPSGGKATPLPPPVDHLAEFQSTPSGGKAT